jgi:hypothetical protein
MFGSDFPPCEKIEITHYFHTNIIVKNSVTTNNKSLTIDIEQIRLSFWSQVLKIEVEFSKSTNWNWVLEID